MKTMTCAQLGGPKGCTQKFHAKTFEAMANLSKNHGMLMYQKADKEHILVMKTMKEQMNNPKAMRDFTETKKRMFDALQED